MPDPAPPPIVEVLPQPSIGQVWRPRRGGMWRTIVAVYPAGVEWTASPDTNAFDRFETWDKWVREAGAYLLTTPERTVP